MNTLHGFMRRMAAGALVCLTIALAGKAYAGPGAPGMATVVHVTGNARYSDDQRNWRTLRKGDRLKPGCLVQTAERASVEIILGDSAASGSVAVSLDGHHGDDVAEPVANVVRMLQDSVLGIDKLPDGRFGTLQTEETQLDLKSGQIMGSVGRLSAGSKYEITLPKGVAGVRSSSRYVLSSSGPATAVSGSMVVVEAAADGSLTTKVVSAGQQFDPATGTIIEAPVGAASINPVKLDSASAHSVAPGSNPALTPGSPANFQRTLPSRQF